MFRDSLDIGKNIKYIESLKSELLNHVSELFSCLIDENARSHEREEVLSKIIISTYLLSDKIGISFEDLDTKIINMLRIAIIQENEDSHALLLQLSKHLESSRLAE